MRRLDRYELLAEIARGGMGVVYRGRDPGLGREVAIKLLLAGRSDPELWLRFRQEAEATARLRHPHIVAVHSAGVAGGRPYLVMDLVEGESLAARLARTGPLAPEEAAARIREVALALQHAHEAGLVHRDVKPANVLVDAEGRARLTDFGIAKALGRDTQVTLTGDILGTPSYMAPEQAAGSRAVGPPADLYALGGTLFALLTGQAPVRGTSVLDIVRRIQEEPPPSPRALRPELDPRLEAICLRCLAKDPAERYPSGNALAAALARYLADEPLEAAPSRPAWGRPALVGGVLAGCAGALLAGWILSGSDPIRAERLPPTPPPIQPAPSASPTPDAGRELEPTIASGAAEAHRLHKGGLLVAKSGNALLARERFLAAIDADPGFLAAYVSLASIEYGQGKIGEARQVVEDGLSIDPSHYDLLCFYGAVLYELDELERSAEVLARACAQDPGKPQPFYNRAQALTRLDRLDEAWEDIERAIAAHDAAYARAETRAEAEKARDGLDRCYANRAALRFKRGDIAGCREDADRALELNPRSAVALRNRATAFRAQGNLLEALADLDAALAITPRDVALLVMRGNTCAALGRAADAYAAARLAASEAPDDPSVLLALGRTAVLVKESEVAVRAFSRLLELDPRGRPRVYIFRALSLADLGRMQEAMADLDTFNECWPKSGDGWLARARIRYRAGDSEGAHEDVIQALKRLPEDSPHRGIALSLRARIERGVLPE